MRGRLVVQLLIAGLVAVLVPTQLALLLIAVAGFALAQVEYEIAPPPAIWDVGDRKQLFIDHRFIEDGTGCQLGVNPPRETFPVLPGKGYEEEYFAYSTLVQTEADGPVRIYACRLEDYGPVISDFMAGRIQRWPERSRGELPPVRDVTLRLYESTDGLQFTRPELGLFERKGSTANNVVLTGRVEATPFYDTNPACPPEERWKLITSENTPMMLDNPQGPAEQGLALWVSPDGKSFTRKPNMLTNDNVETPIPAWWDDRLGKYVAYERRGGLTRVIEAAPRAAEILTGSKDVFVTPTSQSRGTSRVELDDIYSTWTQPPDFVWGPDAQDPPDSDFYQLCPHKYPWAEDVYLGFPPLYRHTPPPVGLDGNDGPLVTQFACSRDGVFWMRPERKPYLAPGLSTECTRDYNFMLLGMARFGDWIYQYYVIQAGTHHGSLNDLSRAELERYFAGRLWCARQRLDGFVSLDFDYTGGEFTSPPMSFSGNRLELNVDTQAAGTLRVELQDAAGNALPGFALADSDEIGGNYIRKVVSWKGASDLSALAGRPLRLHIEARATKLYGFQFK